MPMEEEQGEDQSLEAEDAPPDLVDEGPDEDFECRECVAPRILPESPLPTQKQMEDHRVDHLPFRS